ncbi:unnamed protein product [Rotaria sp. Silwood1]|nr:unnamed protein product [Rotaria sp. Silwood1]
MDIVLNIYDHWLLTPYVYPKNGWPENDPIRQLISLTVLVNIHGNQIQKEIKVTLQNIPFMSLPTIIIFMFEIRGYSKLYDSTQRSYSKY